MFEQLEPAWEAKLLKANHSSTVRIRILQGVIH